MARIRPVSTMRPIALALTLAMATAVQATAQTDVVGTLQHGGMTRTYIVRLPPGFVAGQSRPLVLALHPALSSAASLKATSGWDAVSDVHGFVVVYPNGGLPSGSNGNFAWNSWDFSGAAPDDISFLSALIARMNADYGIDTCRTYMTGFSSGAMMTNSFAAAHPEKLVAIAPVSGGWITAYGGSESQLVPNLPVAVWTWRGSNETFSTGVGTSSRSRTQQDQEQLAYWVSHNHATLTSTQAEVLNYGVPRIYTTSRFDGDAPVWFTEVQGTGHIYQPGAADLIWTRFFSQLNSRAPGCDPCNATANPSLPDCDQDGVGDACELAAGTQWDVNGDGTPDQCASCPSIATYCSTSTTSNGCSPQMSAAGNPGVGASSGFLLAASGVEGQRQGLLFYGLLGPKAAAWAPGNTSTLCVRSPLQRTVVASSGGAAGTCTGALTLDFQSYLAAHPTALGQPFQPGTIVNVQAWFRDPAAPGTTNLSNALQFKTCP